MYGLCASDTGEVKVWSLCQGHSGVPCSVQKPTIKIPFFEWSPPTDILCDKYTDILSDTLVGTLSEIYSDHFWHIFWHLIQHNHILTFYMTFYLAFYLALYLAFCLTFLSDRLSDVWPDTHSAILSGIFSGIFGPRELWRSPFLLGFRSGWAHRAGTPKELVRKEMEDNCHENRIPPNPIRFLLFNPYFTIQIAISNSVIFRRIAHIWISMM
jgi:hypothetical protein